MNRTAASRIAMSIARRLWTRDGKPERQGDEPTSIGRRDYESWSSAVVDGLLEAGYVITPPKRSKP